MSREAPVPVLEFESRRLLPGGAANPAANIVALGGYACQIGLVGEDEFADQLRCTLSERGIDPAGLVVDPERPTTVKTRVMAQMGLRFPQQVARLDRLSRQPVTAAIEAAVSDAVRGAIPQVDAVLLSDYRSGLLTPSLVESVRTLAADKLLTADAQGELSKYSGFALVKCNAQEAADFLGRDLHGDETFAQAAADLRHQLDLTGAMVITRGGDGMTLALADGIAFHAAAPAISDVYDTVGAGDTTIAVLTMALAAGASYHEAAALANIASGIVVRRFGNYTPSIDELIQAIET